MENYIQKMGIVATEFGYNFWVGEDENGYPYYNVIPQNQKYPEGGYLSSDYICKIKKVPNLFNQTK